MNKEGIKLAREHLNLPDSVTDEEIAEGLRGSFLEARIEFRMAWNELKRAVKRMFTFDGQCDEADKL